MTTAAPPETFVTTRVVLRRPTLEDAETLFERWATDPAVTKYLVWRPHESVDEAYAHVERCQTSWEDGSAYVWFLEGRNDGRLLGSVAARRGAHGLNLGYLLATDAWGRGYMVEALQPVVDWWLSQPDVFRVWATCDVDNKASARVLEKAGFQLEGTLRRWERHPNVSARPRDSLCYSKVRE